MGQVETNFSNRRGKHIHDVSFNATRMIIERLNLQHLGLRLINLPLCCPEDADHIEELIPRAKEGLALSLKSGLVTKSELPDLLSETTPMAFGGHRLTTTIKENENTLPEFNHVLATLANLLQHGKVSYYDFITVPQNVSPQLGEQYTYWYLNTDSIGELWGLMGEIETTTRQALYQHDEIPTEVLLKAGHFFAVSQTISRIFSD